MIPVWFYFSGLPNKIIRNCKGKKMSPETGASLDVSHACFESNEVLTNIMCIHEAGVYRVYFSRFTT